MPVLEPARSALHAAIVAKKSMTQQERQGWMIVLCLFVSLFIVWGGGVNTGAVFFPALLKHFGWSRAYLSTLGSSGAIAAGLAGPLVGWLLDRFDARRVMAVGIVTTALAFLGASRADSYSALLIANIAIGIGVTAATVIPCSLILSNWFGARRGLAMGLTFAGTSLGGVGMTIVANWIIARGGWRSGYVAVAIPMLVVVVPLVLLAVKTRPAGASIPVHTREERTALLPGLEMNEAIRTRSFWMICAAQFLFACSAAGAGLHLIAFLIGVGYTANLAAGALSALFLFTSIGKLAMGMFADRVSARAALTVNFAGSMLGMLALIGAHRGVLLVLFGVLYGLTMGAPLVLMPMVMAESLGLKRLGSVMGITGIFATIGAAIGPVVAGRVFDVTGSYAAALTLFVAMLLVASASIFACLPFESERSRLKLAVAA
jgi:MFS family permease